MNHRQSLRSETDKKFSAVNRRKIWRDARTARLLTLFVVLFLGAAFSRSGVAQDAGSAGAAELGSKEKSVDTKKPSTAWQPAIVGQKLAWHDRLRTGDYSRAEGRIS